MVARSMEERIKDIDSRITALSMAQKEERQKMEEKYAQRMADLVKKKTDIEARSRGETSMGNKDERLAFMRALETRNGFGFDYAQALAVLKQVSEGSNMSNAERLAALADEGRVLMQPCMPKRRMQQDAVDSEKVAQMEPIAASQLDV